MIYKILYKLTKIKKHNIYQNMNLMHENMWIAYVTQNKVNIRDHIKMADL